MDELRYSEWQNTFREALLEIDREKLQSKMMKAEEAIFQRLQQLAGTSGSHAEQFKPDLIVLDLSMPVMNGLQAAPILRAMHPKTPIILYTLYADSVVEHEAHLAGISSLVAKGDGSSHLIDEAKTLLKPDVAA